MLYSVKNPIEELKSYTIKNSHQSIVTWNQLNNKFKNNYVLDFIPSQNKFIKRFLTINFKDFNYGNSKQNWMKELNSQCLVYLTKQFKQSLKIQLSKKTIFSRFRLLEYNPFGELI
ncbi:MAG: hypothetical protein LBT66_00550 [Methanobrevibacter sp.]|jgi:signal peptidase I|nr:hypothetical protein [Candidatus Methanovirga meridionalis]